MHGRRSAKSRGDPSFHSLLSPPLTLEVGPLNPARSLGSAVALPGGSGVEQTCNGFLVEIFAKNDKFGYLSPILEKLGVTHDFGWWLIEKPIIDFLLVIIEPFLLLRFWSYEAKCVQLGCFHRGRRICTQILPGQGRPPLTILGIRKRETLDYQTIKTASLCVPSFWHNTGVWRTDGQTDMTDMPPIAYTALAKLVLWRTAKTAVFYIYTTKRQTSHVAIQQQTYTDYNSQHRFTTSKT